MFYYGLFHACTRLQIGYTILTQIQCQSPRWPSGVYRAVLWLTTLSRNGRLVVQSWTNNQCIQLLILRGIKLSFIDALLCRQCCRKLHTGSVCRASLYESIEHSRLGYQYQSNEAISNERVEAVGEHHLWLPLKWLCLIVINVRQ